MRQLLHGVLSDQESREGGRPQRDRQQDLAHAELIRDIPAGGVLRSHDFRRAVLVKQGQSALLTLGQKGNFEIKVRVEALQDGRMGEQIRLKNPESGRLLSGTVMGLNALTGF